MQTGQMMKGKKGVVMGVANDHSIAWGVAKKLHDHGAEMAFTYQDEPFGKNASGRSRKASALKIIVQCDASKEEDLDRSLSRCSRRNGARWISSFTRSLMRTRTS